MENIDIRAKLALDFVKRTDVYAEKVGVEEIDKVAVIGIPKEVTLDVSKEFLVLLVESANTQKLKELYEIKLSEGIREGNRRITTTDVLEIAKLTYNFLSSHWGEITFILAMLERTGKLDKLKKSKRIKTILDTLFDKEKDETDKDG